MFLPLDVAVVELTEPQRVITVVVTSGYSVQLKCDVTGWTELVWKRNGGVLDHLTSDDITLHHDGSLYFADIG